MANITISVKGKFEINLTRNYNSLAVFNENKDDIGFNDSINEFYNYCLSSPCGSWVGDKIKILTLPDKGRLFYNATPLASPTYFDVVVGQEISVRDLIDYKVLKFNGEGTYNNQFTDNYFTTFTFERYCVATSQNVTVSTKLNMIDLKILGSNIYVSDVIRDTAGGTTSFTLHVENQPFVGYMCGVMTNSSVNTAQKFFSGSVAGYVMPLKINPNAELGAEDRKSFSVNIPVGVYTGGTMEIGANTVPATQDVNVDADLIWSLDSIYENGISASFVRCTLDRLGIGA